MADVTGPLAQLFAQVRAAVDFGYGGDPNYRPFYEEGIAALSSIERHVQDMETALRKIDKLDGRYADLNTARHMARAALPAPQGERMSANVGIGPEEYTVIQRGRVVISPEEAMARESVGERLSTADCWHGFDTSLVRSGDRLEERKGQWIHMRKRPDNDALPAREKGEE